MKAKETPRQTRRSLRSTTTSRVQKSKASTSTTSSRRLRKATVENQGQSDTSRLKPKKASPSYLQRSEDQASSDPNRNTRLFALPREIIQEISSHLPIESTICFTLTCKLALHILGTSCWEDERIRKRWIRDSITALVPRTSFLELLHRDVEGAGLKFCKACNTLHPPLKKPSEHRQTKLTKYCWGQAAIVDYLPQSEDGLGFSLVFYHIKEVMASTPPDSNGPIEYLSGSFRVPHPHLNYTVSSSARRINGNLILRHDYHFSPLSSKTPLKATDILDLSFRICPHQTTSRDAPPQNRYIKSSKLNGPLFTHSIVSSFPTSKRTGVPKTSAFRPPTSLESKQMASVDNDEAVIFKCRSCPTKWQVKYSSSNARDEREELVATVFHCFHKDIYSAAKSWRFFVRREGGLLGEGKRNSEFWSQGRTYPDFKIE
ncbi:hypothetical protein F4776DRAFT_306400 [Hypoxylon sp. NC0597]|nr:hypothetical protein F4776DRAFT_306400 [Hypoxylon sp. NC0597]